MLSMHSSDRAVLSTDLVVKHIMDLLGTCWWALLQGSCQQYGMETGYECVASFFALIMVGSHGFYPALGITLSADHHYIMSE